MVVITRGFLLPSSWPLCLCVALPHPLSVVLRKATCDKMFLFTLDRVVLFVCSWWSKGISVWVERQSVPDNVIMQHKQIYLSWLTFDLLTQLSAPVRLLTHFTLRGRAHSPYNYRVSWGDSPIWGKNRWRYWGVCFNVLWWQFLKICYTKETLFKYLQIRNL